MATRLDPPEWQDRLLDHLYASCLLAPLAVWYPAANARAPAGQRRSEQQQQSGIVIVSAQQRQKLRHFRQLAFGLLRRSRDDASAAGAASAADQPPELADLSSLERLKAVHLLSVAADLPTCLQQVMLGAGRRVAHNSCLFI